MDRRQFLSASVALSSAAVLAGQEKKMLPIVDTHQHLWDLKKFRLPWVKADSPLNHTFGPKEYAQSLMRATIVRVKIIITFLFTFPLSIYV